jgi:hypothetical protein
MAPKGCPTPRWIGRLSVVHNINQLFRHLFGGPDEHHKNIFTVLLVVSDMEITVEG